MIYTKADWDIDYLAIFATRIAPPQCAGCGRTGFFGPRQASDDRQYRLCKFCGFYQGIDAEPVQCLATVHGCLSWPTVAGAPYVWWVQPEESQYICPHCGGVVEVTGATVKRPVDDRSHPWWHVPQNLTFEAAASFWLEHGQARVYL